MTAVVFDLGGVLIDWDPRHLYRRMFDGDDAAMETFLARVCTLEWNARLDGGASWSDEVEELARRFPAERDRIVAYRERWPEMLGGAHEATVEILAELRAGGVPVYALSNWAADTFDATRARFPFLAWFDGIVISGEERLLKPDPRIFRVLLERFGLDPAATVYVDDLDANVEAAAALGMRAVRFTGADALRADLGAEGLLDGAGTDAGKPAAQSPV